MGQFFELGEIPTEFDANNKYSVDHYINDFDHLAPLIWKCLEKGDEPVILLTTNFKIEDDYRFKLINQDKNVRIIYDVDKVFEKHFKAKTFLQKVKRKIYMLSIHF